MLVHDVKLPSSASSTLPHDCTRRDVYYYVWEPLAQGTARVAQLPSTQVAFFCVGVQCRLAMHDMSSLNAWGPNSSVDNF
ncbi:unnamed protein product, partial [Iphiclides podalirius]